MTPFDLVLWALAGAVAVIVVGLAIAVSVVMVKAAKNS